MTILAALKPDSQQQVAEIAGEVVKEVLEGIPDATRAEPFTGLMLLGFFATVAAFLTAGWFFYRQQHAQQSMHQEHQERVTTKFTTAIDAMNGHLDTMQGKCHDAHLTCLKLATESANRSANATDNCARMLEKVVAKLT